MKIKKGRYLFICTANENRSPYAEEWFARKAKEQGVKVRVTSAGLAASVHEGRTQLTGRLVDENDYVLVMQEDMKQRLNLYGNGGKRIIVLDIPDIFGRMVVDAEPCRGMTSDEAREYVKHNYRHNKRFRIGKVLFEKLLEGKLEEYFA
jgi:protein-tyrosine-phosphatase